MPEIEIQQAHIEDWEIVEIGGWKQLRGTVTGHPLLHDGTYIHTSEVVHVTEGHARTRNTLYSLGKPGKNLNRDCGGFI